MTLLTVRLTSKELELLIGLSSDQLFRREFIDSRIPGYLNNPSDIGAGKALVTRLRAVLEKGGARKTSSEPVAG